MFSHRNTNMSPKLYMIEISPSSRAVLITANALGITLDKHYIDITSDEHLTPEFLKLNPQHTVPTLIDDDGKVLWDGHAIIFYLANKYGKTGSNYYPDNLYTRALIHQRFHFDAEYLFPPISKVVRDIFHGATSIDPVLIEKMKEGCEIFEKLLEGYLWAAGDQPTLADFSMVATVSSINIVLPIDSEVFPNVAAWLKRAEALPCYKENKSGIQISKRLFQKYLK